MQIHSWLCSVCSTLFGDHTCKRSKPPCVAVQQQQSRACSRPCPTLRTWPGRRLSSSMGVLPIPVAMTRTQQLAGSAAQRRACTCRRNHPMRGSCALVAPVGAAETGSRWAVYDQGSRSTSYKVFPSQSPPRCCRARCPRFLPIDPRWRAPAPPPFRCAPCCFCLVRGAGLQEQCSMVRGPVSRCTADATAPLSV